MVARARSSFTWGMRSLAQERREAIFAVYAFCRVVDDIADSEHLAREERLLLLAEWEGEVDAAYRGDAGSAIGRALAQAVGRFDLPREEFTLMVEGMRTDVQGPVVAPDLAELEVYTRRVAGSVGALSIRIFGARACPERDKFALALADAFQLTNILRDVEEDAAIGRVYLPREHLDAHGLCDRDPTVLIALLRTDGADLAPACAALGAVARARFAEARALLPVLDRSSVRPALMMMGVYEGYLARMEAVGHQRVAHARTMPRWQKLARSLRYAYAFPPR